MDNSSDDKRHTSLAGSFDFRTTHWSEVVKANEGDTTQAREALARLCQEYWYPLYAYVRRRGYDAPDAQDLTQSFFARLLEKDYLKQADRERGRFRTFLLSALQHFVNNEWHKANTLKRGAAYTFVSLEAETYEERYGHELFHDLTPEKLYERRWANTLLENAMTKLKREHERLGTAPVFAALQGYLSGERGTEPYAEVAQRLGLTQNAIKVAVHRLRRSFGPYLRAEIAQTVSCPAEVDEELRHALVSLS